MLNGIWLGMILIAIVSAIVNGRVDILVQTITSEAKHAFEIALGLAGILTFWLGLMRIAQQAGLIKSLAKVIKPIMVRLFPSVPEEHEAMGDMVLNIAANILGLSNAATPFGIKAMESLKKLSVKPHCATDAMCMFLAINTSSVQVLPITAMGYLVAGGASHPANIIITSLIATLCSTVVAITLSMCFSRMKRYKES